MIGKFVLFATLTGLCAPAAHAQVVINEVAENPPGSGTIDDTWEYIELYGKPGLDLTGYAVALFKGGADPDANGVPGPLPAGVSSPDHISEIDEAFSLDGLSLGSNGLLVLYNTNSAGFSSIPALLPAATARAAWKLHSVPSTDVAGKLNNDGSSTYILARRRPFHSVDPMTHMSVYAPGYSFRKDVNPDVNFDSKVDCGTETPVNAEGPVVVVPGPVQIEGYQMVDDVAWSNSGGKEYTRSVEQEISDSPGFNPDGVSRVAFYPSNPMRGSRFDGMGMVVPTGTADEEWVYGELVSLPTFDYDNSLDVDGYRAVKGPTDPNGPAYDGSCNPDDPSSGCVPAAGPYRFRDINLVGYHMTPGALNDVNSSGSGGSDIQQFRFVPHDVNFDGVANASDYAAARAMLGVSLDDETTILCSDGVTMIQGWAHEGRDFQSLLAMTCQDPNDNGGPVVTMQDVTALRVALGFGVAPDQNGDGVVNSADLALLLGAWGTNSPIPDVNGDGVVNSADLALLLGAWG